MDGNKLGNGTNDMDEYTFILSAEEDEELIGELDRAEQGGRLNEHIRNLLRLGHNVHLAATFPLIKNHYNHSCLQLMSVSLNLVISLID